MPDQAARLSDHHSEHADGRRIDWQRQPDRRARLTVISGPFLGVDLSAVIGATPIDDSNIPDSPPDPGTGGDGGVPEIAVAAAPGMPVAAAPAAEAGSPAP